MTAFFRMSPKKTSKFLALRANVHFANVKHFFTKLSALRAISVNDSPKTIYLNSLLQQKITNPKVEIFLVKIHDNSILRLHETTPRGLETTEIFLGEAPRPPSARHTSIYVAAHIYCVLQFCTITNSSGFCFIWK